MSIPHDPDEAGRRADGGFHLRPLTSGVPAGRSGEWVIERYEVTAPPPHIPENRPDWAVPQPGRYTRLKHVERVFMTDQHDEWWTQRPAIGEACRRGGRVLLTGLGLGLVAESMLTAPASAVESITIVEASTDVISLVEPYLTGRYGRVIDVVHASAFEWRPAAGAKYTVGWHDIWESPWTDECKAEERMLLDRFAPYCDWQGAWSSQWREDDLAARPS